MNAPNIKPSVATMALISASMGISMDAIVGEPSVSDWKDDPERLAKAVAKRERKRTKAKYCHELSQFNNDCITADEIVL
jgi:hypothetical protein